jgi:predicted membrane channel-forming protein YqfA (hemolysin III family)
VSKQWLQIVAIWAAALVFGILALLTTSGELLYTLFAGIAATAIALVSIEHLISAKAKDTIRQQVYVSAGTMTILATLTLISFAG